MEKEIKLTLTKVTKSTRAKHSGTVLFCPHCLTPQLKIYHFAWFGLYCENKKCKMGNNKFVNKYDWLVIK